MALQGAFAGVESGGDMSLCRKVETVLRDQIADGTLAPGLMLPAEDCLRTQFGVSRGTLRRALGRLERDGLVRRVHGRGTFVAGPDTAEPSRQRMDIDELIRSARQAVRLDRFGRSIPPRIVATSLELDPRIELGFFIRVSDRLGKCEAVGIKRYLAPKLSQRNEELAAEPDFEAALCHAGNLQRGEAWSEAVLAEPRFAALLGVQLGAPLLSTWWVTLLDGRPVACNQMLRAGSTTAIKIASGDCRS